MVKCTTLDCLRGSQMIDARITILYILVLKQDVPLAELCQGWYKPEPQTISLGPPGDADSLHWSDNRNAFRLQMALMSIPHIMGYWAVPAFAVRYLNPRAKLSPWIRIKGRVAHWWAERDKPWLKRPI